MPENILQRSYQQREPTPQGLLGDELLRRHRFDNIEETTEPQKLFENGC
jgi:hypothetical protein